MLTKLEDFLMSAIKSSLPDKTILTGPLPEKFTFSNPVVTVYVDHLKTSANDAAENKREPAFFTSRQTFQADGKQLDFKLPDDKQDHVLEVEFPVGHLVKQGDDYWLEAGSLHFYRPPASDFKVLLRGALAQGYQTSQPCSANICIEAWDPQRANAETWLGIGLAASLAAFVGVNRFELTRLEAPNFSLRLLDPELVLLQLNTVDKATDNGMIYGCRAALQLKAELEASLALGLPQPEGLISDVVINYQGP